MRDIGGCRNVVKMEVLKGTAQAEVDQPLP